MRASLADVSQIFLDRPFCPGVYNLSLASNLPTKIAPKLNYLEWMRIPTWNSFVAPHSEQGR
jgi:hypothetical protein